MGIFNWMVKPVAKYRLNTIRIATRNYYDSIVRHCCGVTKVSDDIAFIVHRSGVFGGPVVERIRKPETVILSDRDDYVIVMDGYVYELKKEMR